MFPDENITGPNCRDLVFPDGDMQAQIPNTTPKGLVPSAFHPSLEYSTDNVMLFWQPPFYFSQWSP